MSLLQRQLRQLGAMSVLCMLMCTQLSAQAMVSSPSAPAVNRAVLWKDPGDIRSLDLFYGPGGKKHVPQPPFQFVKEDLKGTSPKFDITDGDGKKWRAKVGPEARPETVASRLLWAMGYGANENYFFPDLKIDNLPARLSRGQSFVSAPGDVNAVRLQRHPGGEKKAAVWHWRANPFFGTREFNGLRVMMALINNWDLKDENNAIYDDPSSGRELYEVTDVGASFGKTGKSYTDAMSKGNVKEYTHSKFISKITPEYVSFNFPTHPPLISFIFPFFWSQMHLRWIGRHIPRADVQWIASRLAQLSPKQIRDALRAGGFQPAEVEALATTLEHRIAELNHL